ncbi:MAG TPA: PIG-L family deacetylase, partial [Chloroflexota bacterium]|nr:PIG-L family deacetylase [Chloroflexota bacterium]
MAIFAHPDDESMGTGGTLARYAAEGVEVSLVTATRGERGWFGPGRHPGFDKLAERREKELRAAARVLGIKRVDFLNYIDGELDQAPPAQVIAQLVAHIRRVRPQVVVTFGHDGAYGHPDHIAISQLTTAAVLRAADPCYGPHSGCGSHSHSVSKLYHMVTSEEQGRLYEQAFGDISMEIDGVERRGRAWRDWEITTTIEADEYWRTAWQAVACHRSQLPNYESLLQQPE